MQTTTYTRAQTTLRLERFEEFIAENDKGLPFYVRAIHYGGGDKATLSGPAKTKQGERGYTDRNSLVALDDLRPDMAASIRASHESSLRAELEQATAHAANRTEQPTTEQTGLELQESTWPCTTLDGQKVTQTAARRTLDQVADRIRWAADTSHLDVDDVADARWVAEELEQDGEPWSWTYRGHDRAELERAIVTWAMVTTEENETGRTIRITDRLA